MSTKNNFISKLFMGCSDDPLFEAKNLIYFKNGKAHCTNGYIAIIQDLDLHLLTEEDIENLEDKFIHRSTFKDLYKYKEVYFQKDRIVAMTESNTEAIFSYYPFTEKWLEIEDVFNGYSMNSIDEIGVNPTHIRTINDCLVKSPHAGMHFRFDAKNKAILVTSIDENAKRQKAVLMPCAMNDSID
jgi:hypothetical protein